MDFKAGGEAASEGAIYVAGAAAVIIAGDDVDAVRVAFIEGVEDSDGFFSRGSAIVGQRDKVRRGIAVTDGEWDREIGLIHAVGARWPADQGLGSKSTPDQVAGRKDAIAGVIARQHDDYVGRDRRLRAHQVAAESC